jgi:hypothetical protein
MSNDEKRSWGGWMWLKARADVQAITKQIPTDAADFLVENVAHR